MLFVQYKKFISDDILFKLTIIMDLLGDKVSYNLLNCVF